MNLATRSVILLCGIYICEAGYGYGDPPPQSQDTQSDVQAPAYVPPYAKNSQFTKTSRTGYGAKKYSGTKTSYGSKTYSGTKTSYGTKTYSGTKTAYSGTKTAYGEKSSWNSQSGNAPKYEDFNHNANQPYTAKCEPDCQNNGICVDTNTCHCPPNFKGRYCEIASKPCLSFPPLPANSLRRCTSEFCTITCFEGYKFAGLGTTAANLVCSVDGTWEPTVPLLAALPDCEPQCSPPCLNGGVCLAIDTCQCPAEYRGPQCQYSASVCDIRKLSFNGGYSCAGDAGGLSCSLSCPAGVGFSSPPAALYRCTYHTGRFEPQPVPHCVYGEAHIVEIHHESGAQAASYSHSSEQSNAFDQQSNGFDQQSNGFDHQSSGFDQQSNGFDQQSNGFDQQSNGFDQQSNGFDQQSNGFDQQSNGFDQQSNGFDQQSVFDQTSSTRKPMKLVVEDISPKGGVCLTWAGTHYKTFDGKIYSFQSPCQHILLREQRGNKYTVAIKQQQCKRQAYCPSELTVYLEDKHYVLSIGEDGSVIFRSTKRIIPIPAELTGIRVSQFSDYILVNLDGAGVTIKWDTNNLVLIEATVQLWNNTEGLCGTLNSHQEDDFLTKDTGVAPTQSAFVASWQLNKIGDVCTTNPTDTSACLSDTEELRQARLFCAGVFSRDKFRQCSRVMDVTRLLETCQWDYCACANSESSEECACATVAVYAKECLRNGIQDMKHWRDKDTCPMKCPEGKIYNVCGSDSQPSCAFATIATIDNTTCVEGCFCPQGTLLEAGKCVPKSECPCRLRNKAFKPGSVVRKDCNTCSCVAGEWVCTAAPCGARCSAIGDPHYTTFDGTRYDFMGRCTYEMLKADNVTIEAENVACSGAISEAMNLTPYKGAGKPSCTKAVNVKYDNVNVHLKQGGYILVNGQEVSALPVVVGGVRIRAASSLFVIVQLPNKLDVWWDGNTRVYIDVPPEFHEKTKGLCGTFNLNQKDDFLTPEGDVEQSAHAFANKWKTREFCEDVDISEPEHPCKANVENKEAAENYCSRLKSKLFEECHWYVDVDSYYSACVYDMCACAGDISRCLCPALGDYAMACAKAGVKIQWRYSVKECEPVCGVGQEYTVCADSCLRTCTDVGVSECRPACVEGCACPAGQVLDDSNQCVPVGLCPCYHKGVKFDAGYKECRPGRRERELCTCVGARWECVPATDNDIQNYPPAEDLKTNCSAANHMEFTSCETAEPLTCKNMHIPPSSTPAECRPGCQCKKGYVLDTVSKKCVLATECPCHHGGRSYPDSHTMQEECNECVCTSGKWSCSQKQCAGECAAWGDSHVVTFDGAEYDFEGVCTYLLAKGKTDATDGFSVEIQNVPCGSTGATCSKSVTLRVGSGNDEEIATLNKDSPLPDLSKLKRIRLRVVGVYVYLDVPRLGMSVQWDRGMRVYVKVDSMWNGRLKGLCGNYNSDKRDDYQTPGGGIPESSALIFVDSWKLKSNCPKPQPVIDHCKQRPERKDYADTTCGAIKRYPFTLCHAEVPPSSFEANCVRDACACDTGDDCACTCTALAAYAHACAKRGVAVKWRTQQLCPMQCDEECSNYNECLSSCPLETCDNTLDYTEIKATCEQDTCVEGCKPKKSCPQGSVYTNDTFTECVPRSQCRRVCMTQPDGKELLEGEIIDEDACHTCRCSKRHRVCTGQPCASSALPYILPIATTEKPHSDETLKCVTGWTEWLNRGRPETGTNGESVDKEPLPKPNELQIGSPMCQPAMMTQVECRTTVNHKTAKETGLNAECSLERGLVCSEKGNVCPDFEIRVYCQCEEQREEPPPTAIKPEPEPFQCLNADHPNYPHPTDCAKFYECTPDELNPTKKHAVLKNCGPGLMYNPTLMVCDWPASVMAIRPECGATKPTEPTTTVASTKAPVTTTHVPVPIASKCPPGQEYSECAFPCDKLCHHFKHTMFENGRCKGFEKCVEGCVASTCKPGWLWRDEHSCVPSEDCTCFFNGKLIKPAGIAVDGCKKCQCLLNDLHCDTSDCASPAPSTLPPALPPAIPATPPSTSAPLLIVKNTATPPPECSPEGYKNLLWEVEPLPPTSFAASSTASALFKPEYAKLNAHLSDTNAGSWSPEIQDQNQYIQVTLPRREPIYGVIMQGSPLFDQYVTSYEIMYGDDGNTFSLVEDKDGKPKVFRGPVDHSTPAKQMLESPVEARVVRVRPLTWHDSIAVRFELIGCGQPAPTTPRPLTTPAPLQCTDPLGLASDLPIENIEVSSNNDLREHFLLEGHKGWKPAYSTPGEWIMFDFTSPRNITGIKTKGGPTGWVTSYNILYTSDLQTFNPVVDNTGSYKIFPANFDQNSLVFNEFTPPIHARYLKVLPLKWKDSIEMRVEPIGCFEPYPVTEPISYDETTPLEPTCAICPGVQVSPDACDCVTPGLSHYDGEGCVSRDQCPCVEGFMTYAVGSTFRGDACDECVCKLGGITDCKPVKECLCAADLVPKLTSPSCECTCSACPAGTRICPTSKVCLPLGRWCDGLQDCPDDERDCGCRGADCTKPTTIEPTLGTTVAPTVGIAPTTPAVAVKPVECPKAECPPGYFVHYVTSSYSRGTSDLPPPRSRNSYSRYTKGGYQKGGYSSAKGGYSKGGGGTKGGYVPALTTLPSVSTASTTPQPTTTPKPANAQVCAQFKCIPNLPPPFKPGATPPPKDCAPPICPPKYTLKLDPVALEPNQCPQYICVPPPETYAYCNMTGRTFNTFDGAEYKFDVCFHILARDSRFNAWSVLVRKICSIDGCVNQLVVQQDDDIIVVKPNLMIQYNQYEYTVEQTSKICFQKNSFDVTKLGNGLAIKSRRYDFGVLYSTDGNVKVAVNTKYKYMVDGLCGYYDGDVTNERRKPDGTFATSIDEFAQGWARPGLRADACEIKIIPPEKQRRAWDLCDVVTKEPFNQCGRVMNLDKWRSICLEKVCECADLVSNGSKKTEEECRCQFLETLIAQCLADDKSVDLGDWRLQMDCPSACPAPLVAHDCYVGCEPTCGGSGACPAAPGQCYPGCYCPRGTLRRAGQCVTPQHCRDCTCTGVGAPAKYVSFEGDDLPYLGNCTYLASRDRNETGQHKYQVFVSNGPCEDQSQATCVKAVHLIYGKNVVHVTKDDVTGKLITTVNSVPIFKFPESHDWITLDQVNGQDINMFLPEAYVEVVVLQSKMEFSVKVPSHVYANKTEGLCGVCAGYREELITSNGTVAENFEEYGLSWLAPPTALQSLGIPPQECGAIPPPPQCKPPPEDQNPCNNLRNPDRFGACHALVDPQPFIEACEEELCSHNSTDACAALARYAAECRRAGICPDWREGLCPYPCSAPMVYNPCMQCEETCENYEEVRSSQTCHDQTAVEGCFCASGKVRVNNTCVEETKCFPCDAEKKHYVGDEWQENACTTCTCMKLGAESFGQVSCVVQACRSPVCGQGEDLITKPTAPGQCCPEYICVPKAAEAQCEEPKTMECGYGQVLKQKKTAAGCTQFACECKPPSECEHIPGANEVDILEPGMERAIDDSGCCPRPLMLCKPETCPEPPPCPKFHTLNTDKEKGKCCASYSCESPKDKCIVSLEWEESPKGGEKQRDVPQTVLKELEATWRDGPCRYCSCARTPLGAAPHCATTACAPVVATEQFVLEPKPVPFQCCPEALYVACRDGDNIYKVGEKWTSPDNVCESYKCVKTGDNKLEKVTTVEQCHTDCEVGWQYFPAEAGSGSCCGKCRPVACVCEGVERAIGQRWTSADHCTTYTCVNTNGTIQVEMMSVTCPEVSVEMKKQFVLEEKQVPGQCCKAHEPVACRVGNNIYQEGQSWNTTDPCKSISCARDGFGRLAHTERAETCRRDCARGWLYAAPAHGYCCGHCVQAECVVAGQLWEPGSEWHSADNCTTFRCSRDGASVVVSSSRETCPDVSHCDPADLVNGTCCQTCQERPAELSTCVPTALALEAGAVSIELHGRGRCTNHQPAAGFKECRGTCPSGTLYNNRTGAHDSQCECCQTAEYEHVIIPLTCEDGSSQRHQVASPRRCACRQCGQGPGFLPWPATRPSWDTRTEEDQIPDIYQRFGPTRSPRKN